jgi:hypothetical protein
MGSKLTPRYQLRVGMDGETNIEFIPLHRSAFAKHLPLAVLHTSPVDAHLELSQLLHWLLMLAMLANILANRLTRSRDQLLALALATQFLLTKMAL